MALAEKLLGGEFNRPGFNIVDHYTYVFCGDGCLMEGISHEACSFAGTLGLGKLIVFYDDNGISIDGKVVGWFTDDTPQRFEAYGWHVVPAVDGLDAQAVSDRDRGRARGNGTPVAHLLQDHHRLRRAAQAGHGRSARRGAGRGRGGRGARGARLAVPAVRGAGRDPQPPGIIASRAPRAEASWRELFARYASQFPEAAREFERRMRVRSAGQLARHRGAGLAGGT